jgi:cytochrome c oxidase subunit 3
MKPSNEQVLEHGHGHHHDPHLSHQFEDMNQQNEAYTVGMWVFLVTELMFFGGLFAAYIVYRSQYYDGFYAGHEHLSVMWGGINTMVLLTSSFTMAMAVRAAMLRQYMAQIGFLVITFLCACGFMVIKAIEYTDKYNHHLIPGPNFDTVANPVPGTQLFYSLYFAMTGLHGFHVLVGMIVIAIFIVRTWINRKKDMDYMPVEMAGLYWHFVDLVWIFLYPLLYLMGRSAH